MPVGKASECYVVRARQAHDGRAKRMAFERVPESRGTINFWLSFGMLSRDTCSHDSVSKIVPINHESSSRCRSQQETHEQRRYGRRHLHDHDVYGRTFREQNAKKALRQRDEHCRCLDSIRENARARGWHRRCCGARVHADAFVALKVSWQRGGNVRDNVCRKFRSH